MAAREAAARLAGELAAFHVRNRGGTVMSADVISLPMFSGVSPEREASGHAWCEACLREMELKCQLSESRKRRLARGIFLRQFPDVVAIHAQAGRSGVVPSSLGRPEMIFHVS
jgi:hypothetical protein